MKIIESTIKSNLSSINDNLSKYVKNNKIILSDYLSLDNESIHLIIDDVSLGFLNSLRHIAFKYDYVYYLNVYLNDIEVISISNKSCDNSINKSEVINRLNSIVIDNNDEDLLNNNLEKTVGKATKKIKIVNSSYFEYITTKDITFNKDININIDKNIRIHHLPPYVNNLEFIINNISINKGYGKYDSRFLNVCHFTILPVDDKNNLIIDNYDFNKTYKRYKLEITSTGYLKAVKLLPRILNILYIRLNYGYVVDNDQIQFLENNLFLENLLVDYCHNNNINIICKIIKESLYCFNISTKDMDKILNMIKDDIILMIAELLNINKQKAKNQLDINEFAKYYF
jgi:hypothetical protein